MWHLWYVRITTNNSWENWISINCEICKKNNCEKQEICVLSEAGVDLLFSTQAWALRDGGYVGGYMCIFTIIITVLCMFPLLWISCWEITWLITCHQGCLNKASKDATQTLHAPGICCHTTAWMGLIYSHCGGAGWKVFMIQSGEKESSPFDPLKTSFYFMVPGFTNM